MFEAAKLLVAHGEEAILNAKGIKTRLMSELIHGMEKQDIKDEAKNILIRTIDELVYITSSAETMLKISGEDTEGFIQKERFKASFGIEN